VKKKKGLVRMRIAFRVWCLECEAEDGEETGQEEAETVLLADGERNAGAR